MIAQLKRIFYLNGYLLIAAAWLFTLSFIFSNYLSYTSSIKGVKNSLQERVYAYEKDFREFVTDTALMRRLAEDQYTERGLEKAVDKAYGFYLYDVNTWQEYKLVFWNNQRTEPEHNRLFWGDTTRFRNLANGQYVMWQKTIPLNGKRILAVGLLQVREEYFIRNTYLQKRFIGLSGAEDLYKITDAPNEYRITDLNENSLFYLDYKSNVRAVEKPDWVSIVLRLAGVLMVLFFIQTLAEQIAARKGAWSGIAVLGGTVALIRLLSYHIPFPFRYRDFELFDPTIFASDFIHPSLGDLLINALLFFWIILFTRNKLAFAKVTFSTWAKWKRWTMMIVLNVFLLTATYYVCDVIKSLVKDSTVVSLNVTDFFSLNEYSVVGFVILACISLGYFYLMQLLLKVVDALFPNELYIKYLVPAIMGLLYLTILSFGKITGLQVFTLFWLILIIWLNSRQVFFAGKIRLNFAGTLFWLFIFSASITAVLIEENRTKELEQRKNLAEKLSLQADRSSERLLSIALTYIDNYFLSANFHQFHDPESNRALKERLINMNFSGYLNKYDTKLYTYDAAELPLYNEDSTSYNTLNTILTVQGKRTNIPGLFYVETAFDKFSYISKREVTDTANQTLGYLYFISKPKKYKGEALSPELFKQPGDYDPEYSPFYSYAVYNKYELVNNYKEYPFPTRLDKKNLPVEDIKIINRGDYDELWYKVASDKYVVIARKVNSLMEAITLFAYIFCSFLALVALFRVISLTMRSRFRWRYLREMWQFNIRTQVHSTIIFISLFSFVVIGVATISFFINRYNNNNRDRLSRAMQIMVNEVKNKMKDHAIFDDVLKLYETGADGQLVALIEEISEIHNADVNLYDLDGRLRASSRQIVYDKGILSENIQPEAYYKLHVQNQVQVVQQENIGKLEFLSIYAPVRDEQGEPYAYLNIPYFASEKELNQEISNFLVTIINLNAFIFLVAGVIALFIANRITQSFSLIADKMRDVNLGKMNEEISWNRDDEIGDLVKEYNKMVHKLEESAVALAKSEREGAWREMARQVAHEIKNPLTPMKLSIQYLQKAIDNNSGNVKEMTRNVASTLIEQIEHLAKIASDFSQFANIGNPRKERFDFHEMMDKLISLYQTNENLEVRWEPLPERIWVFQDKTQMNRLFTNLLQNAWEACQHDASCLVVIREEKTRGNEYLRVSIADNGEGIPIEMQSKIFTPNFTTKTSGTGLGLAMCKSIAEQAKGKIWFETIQGEGTVFHVEIPLADTDTELP